jgi:hypothetical protein
MHKVTAFFKKVGHGLHSLFTCKPAAPPEATKPAGPTDATSNEQK